MKVFVTGVNVYIGAVLAPYLLDRGLSVRATEEACTYLEHPTMEHNRQSMLEEVLKSSFCGRFPGRWNDESTDAGVAWSLIESGLREIRKKAKESKDE